MTLKELTNRIESKHDSWDFETNEIFNELWGRMEAAEIDVEVFELRVKKQWTKGSNLYTEKEVKNILERRKSTCEDFDDLSPLEQMMY